MPACAAARLELAEAALAYLRQAISAGFDDAEGLQSTPHLHSLRHLPEFAVLQRQVGDA